ncbi:MAG: MOSC domain-containing protein [Rothia sp. (in: high G+C Gram-positive bacteria)]|nr:MOSC domain-containing protein [Rothia sp. (in: high G+C Gram-positive bacteria)]
MGDSKHHGGADKSVYAFAREELDFWGTQLGEHFANGHFGENLTTFGVDWSAVPLLQRITVGSAVLEVSVPRSPCRTFASWLDQRGWVKTFTEHGDAGAYLRVLQPGTIHPGDSLQFAPAPQHGVSMGEAFAAVMGNKEAARKVAAARVLPGHHHTKVEKIAGFAAS